MRRGQLSETNGNTIGLCLWRASAEHNVPIDKRISHGCINVPKKFYENIVRPTFTGTSGIVYVLPEIRSNREIFA